jgi:hypothetical protein
MRVKSDLHGANLLIYLFFFFAFAELRVFVISGFVCGNITPIFMLFLAKTLFLAVIFLCALLLLGHLLCRVSFVPVLQRQRPRFFQPVHI